MYVDLKHLQNDCGLYDYHGKELMGKKNIIKHNELSFIFESAVINTLFYRLLWEQWGETIQVLHSESSWGAETDWGGCQGYGGLSRGIQQDW